MRDWQSLAFEVRAEPGDLALAGLAAMADAELGHVATDLALVELALARVLAEVEALVAPRSGAALGVGVAHAGSARAVDAAALALRAGFVDVTRRAHRDRSRG